LVIFTTLDLLEKSLSCVHNVALNQMVVQIVNFIINRALPYNLIGDL